MNGRIETVSFAMLHSVRAEFLVLAAVFAVLIGVTIALVVREIKNDT